MKRIASLSGLLALVFVGCGLISSPPIDNPFGLQGQQSTIDLQAATGTATATATFNDITLNSPLTPTGFTYNLAISNVQFSGSGCPSPLPTSVAVSANVTITVSDNPTSGPRTASAQATNVQFNLNASGSGYTVSNLTGGSLTFSNLQTLLNILQNGGENTATLNATVNTTSNPDLAGCTMTITWGGGQGVLKF
jgi:membrane-associated protease RseP (regulator of RpoE activity)